MHKKRKETTHVRVCEKHTSIYKEYKYNVCQNGHKTHVEEINVSKVERKEKIHKILTTSLISKLPRKKFPIRTLPLSMTTLISKLLPIFVTSDKG